MTRKDFITKWLIYAVALLPVWFVEIYLLSRVKLFGVSPMLLPVAAVIVAVLEGVQAGAGFGMAAGILCDTVYHTHGAMTVGLAALGAGVGIAARYLVRQDLPGCLLCAAGALGLMDLVRVGWYLASGAASLGALARVAVPEVLFSLAFVFPLYPLLRWVHERIQFATLF